MRHFAFTLALLVSAASLRADTPSVSYIFPAGGQRGKAVDVRVGGHYLHEGAPFRLDGPGVQAAERIERTKTIWFEGPVIPQPASQAKEDYPKDYAGKITIAQDAPLGTRTWRVWTSQGVVPGMPFVVGELPEVVEQESDGRAIPVPVTLPVTINGRIFPREDVDIWAFQGKAGQTVTCEVNAARIGSPLDARLEIRSRDGSLFVMNSDELGNDPRIHCYDLPADDTYYVHIYDEKFGGLQHYTYRLTLTAGPWVDHVYPLGGRRGEKVTFEATGANLVEREVRRDPQTHQAREPAHVEKFPVELPADPQRTTLETQFTVRGQKTNPVTFELDDLPEIVSPLPPPPPPDYTSRTPEPQKQRTEVPAVLNGRIEQPGSVDLWTFPAKKGDAFEFDVRASRLGSPLDSVLTLLDAEGKQLAQNDDFAGAQTDSRITWTAPADGDYTLRVEDRLTSRGGLRYAYRLRVAPPPKPDFRLNVQGDSLTVERLKSGNVRINADRIGGFGEEIELEIAGLPEGVEVTNNKIPKGQPGTQLTFKPGEKVRIQTAVLTIRGKAKIGDQEVVRTVETTSQLGAPRGSTLFLAVGMPTPFKFAGLFETKFFPRGSVYTRRYPLERNGFTGPVEISLADRQNRHLQGVTGPVVTVPPDANEFEYSVTMPPWMEIGRTSRSCLMAVGVVTDFDGSQHKVSYTSEQQNDQIITLVDPGRLSVTTVMKSLRVKPGETVEVPIELVRGVGLTGPVTVSLVLAEHIKGVATEPVTIAAGATKGTLKLTFAKDHLGPFNMPATLKGVIADERGNPVTSLNPMELVEP